MTLLDQDDVWMVRHKQGSAADWQSAIRQAASLRYDGVPPGHAESRRKTKSKSKTPRTPYGTGGSWT